MLLSNLITILYQVMAKKEKNTRNVLFLSKERQQQSLTLVQPDENQAFVSLIAERKEIIACHVLLIVHILLSLFFTLQLTHENGCHESQRKITNCLVSYWRT